MKAAQTAAHALRKEMLVFNASSDSDLDAAFATMAQQQVRALLYGSDTFFVDRRDHVISLAAHYRIPAMSYVREYVQAGSDSLREQGSSVQESTKFELVINLKTAKELGVEGPISMQLLADEHIE